ncbi:hypothetical protein NDU88_002885 [Pleurodeles waltl]|uniref:Putative nuclease HARBI1 n=1 Tax=Pleurodeles waltl TaxID=8319 RepID=A0AAV7WR69_PLEWA|nr:hypothetical protein NDU88_002885 [Pleurodeles waltl]
MQHCAAVFDRLPQRCTTPAQLPHIPLSHFRGQAAAISGAHMASFSTASHIPRPILKTHTGHFRIMICVLCKLWVRTSELVDSVLAVVLHRHRPLGHVRRWRHPPVYRLLVDLSTMEERHVIITYSLDRATIQELCTQLEPDLMSAIRHPTGIPPQVQVLSVLHFLASGSFQTTVAIASGMSQPMFSNVLSRVFSALLKHMRSYIVFPQVEDLPTVKSDFYALGHIPNIIGAIDGTHVAVVYPPRRSEQVYRNRKSYHSMNVHMVCLADQYISHVNAKFPGSVHDAYILQNSIIPYMMGQHQRHCVWLLALRRQVPFLLEDGPDGGVVAAVEPVDSEDEEAEELDIGNRDSVILQYFQWDTDVVPLVCDICFDSSWTRAV